jgi:hypothetical protein
VRFVVLKRNGAAAEDTIRQPRTFSYHRMLAFRDPCAFVWRLAALGWAVVIIWLSTEGFGTRFSRTMEAGLLDLLHISISTSTFLMLHAISRKLAHMIEYGVFCFLLYRSFGNQNRIYWRSQVAFWSVLAAATYSLTDEFHQLFVPGRGASLMDCALDTMGAAIAMFLIYAYSRARGRVSEDCA